MKGQKLKPTEKEMEILQVLWEQGSRTVREVHDTLSETTDSAYTTTLKFMQIMHEKGLVSRTKSGKSHIYTPVPSREEMQDQVLNKVLETTFKGSAMSLVMKVLGSRKSSKSELKEIREYIRQLEGGQK